MRKLPEADIEKILDFVAEAGELLPPYALEKDAHILEAMRLIEKAAQNSPFRLVFCGGTCLSKAYGILDRMSEDVDYKLAPAPQTEALSKSKLRQALSAFAEAAATALRDGGFGEEAVKRISRDANSYTRLDVSYESAFDKPAALRSHLLVEFNYSPVRLEPSQRPVGLLLEKLATGGYGNPFQVQCIALQEALAEKLVSFPRRLSLLLSRNTDPAKALGDPGEWDQALVRHLYDVRCILQLHPELAADTKGLARLVDAVVRQDMADFANQHPAFRANPGLELRQAMNFAQSRPELAEQFAIFVRDMAYEPTATRPSYEEAFGLFEGTLSQSLAKAAL